MQTPFLIVQEQGQGRRGPRNAEGSSSIELVTLTDLLLATLSFITCCFLETSFCSGQEAHTDFGRKRMHTHRLLGGEGQKLLPEVQPLCKAEKENPAKSQRANTDLFQKKFSNSIGYDGLRGPQGQKSSRK